MLLYRKPLLVVGISIAALLVYRQYKQNESALDERENYQYAKEYFIGDDNIHARKPYLWIHVQGEMNARNWESFGSRNSTNLNQPYFYVTIKSILDKCKESFNVFLIDDDSFHKLVPNWKINMDALPSPSKEHYRQFGLTSLLYHYGGFTVPASTLCLEDLQGLYKASLEEKDAFAVQTTVDAPDPLFMGSVRHGDVIRKLRDFEGSLLQKDHTAEADFNRTLKAWCEKYAQVVCGGKVGVKKKCGDPVDLADLLGNNRIDFHEGVKAVYFPAEEILRRPKYAWFARMSVAQLRNSDLAVVTYMR